MSNRRNFVALAERVRTIEAPKDGLVEAIVAANADSPDFDADRFKAHALGTHGDEKWAYNRATQTGGFIPAPRVTVDPLAARRSYVDLSEAIRALTVSADVKQTLAAVAIEELRSDEAPGFDGDRFRAHALSTFGDEKWAYNRANGGPVLSDADTVVL